MLPFFVCLDWMGQFRSDPLTEVVGLDLSYHGVGFHLITNSPQTDHATIARYMQRREQRLDQIKGQQQQHLDGQNQHVDNENDSKRTGDCETNSSSTLEKSSDEGSSGNQQ